jgi:hypothetical protein
MATQSLTPDSQPGFDPHNTNEPISSRRSSASSSSSQTGRVSARPQSHTPTASKPYTSPNEDTEVLASQSDLSTFPQPPTQKDVHLRIPSLLKGKQRGSNSFDRPATMFNIGEEKKREYRSPWIIDEDSGRAGADAWVERDRVVLVLGRKSLIDQYECHS